MGLGAGGESRKRQAIQWKSHPVPMQHHFWQVEIFQNSTYSPLLNDTGRGQYSPNVRGGQKKKKSSPKPNWDVFTTDTMKSIILLIHIPWPFKMSLNPEEKKKKSYFLYLTILHFLCKQLKVTRQSKREHHMSLEKRKICGEREWVKMYVYHTEHIWNTVLTELYCSRMLKLSISLYNSSH